MRRHPPHHLSPARAKHLAGQNPKLASAAPSHHSNAPIKPESQSILSKIVARWSSYSPAAAAALMATLCLSTMAGRLLAGFLVDYIFAPYVAAFFFLLPCVGMYLLSNTIVPVLGIMSLGLVSGTEVDMIGYMTSRYFGLKRFGQIYGYVFAIFADGAAHPCSRIDAF